MKLTMSQLQLICCMTQDDQSWFVLQVDCQDEGVVEDMVVDIDAMKIVARKAGKNEKGEQLWEYPV